jgi:predicted alpha/beta-hydrolase family hydrolase
MMEEPFETEALQGVLHRPDTAAAEAFALTHGAGSDCHAPLVARMARGLAANGYLVLRYNLPFRRERRKGPPAPGMAARDRQGIAHAIEALRAMVPGRVFAGGHSYGGRQTAMAAAEHPALAAGLLLLSYPLHPPTRPEQKRTAYFADLRTAALFVHGANDPFGSLEEMREAISLIPAPTALLPVEGAGHDLKRAPDLMADILERFHALVCYPEK